MSEPGKDISHVPTLSSDNYSLWKRKMNAYLRFNDFIGIVHGTELRPTDAAARADWDKRATRAAGAIEMTLDDKNSTHVEGIEGNPVLMWQKLDSMHNNKTPGTRFNAMDVLFSVRKEDESLGELITRVKGVMSRVKALRPAAPNVTVTDANGNSSTSITSTAAYTLEMLDDELVIMALLRALPDDYKHLRSALLIQKVLALQTVEDAFLAEDNQRQHQTRNGANTTALWAFTPRGRRPSPSASSSPSTVQKDKSNVVCFFCEGIGHYEADCNAKKKARNDIIKRRHRRMDKANAAEDADPTTDAQEEFAANASTLPIPSKARSNLNADTGATRCMMGEATFFSSLRSLVRTIRLANGASIQSKGEGDIVFQPWVNGEFCNNHRAGSRW